MVRHLNFALLFILNLMLLLTIFTFLYDTSQNLVPLPTSKFLPFDLQYPIPSLPLHPLPLASKDN
jgi:hypothetical protein